MRVVLDEDYLNQRIVIDNVSHYAYGQHNDGEVGIWVAGRAGWFSISPAKGYRAMFNEVVEAIDLLYFLTDRHKPKRSSRRRKSWNPPSLEYLCDEYVLHTHGICEDGDDSAEVLYKHHNFLLSRMMRGEEDVNWVETSVFKHLCEKFPVCFDLPIQGCLVLTFCRRIMSSSALNKNQRRLRRRKKIMVRKRMKMRMKKWRLDLLRPTRQLSPRDKPTLFIRSFWTSKKQGIWPSGN